MPFSLTLLKWSWQDCVEREVKRQIKGFVLHVCCGKSFIGDLRIDLYQKDSRNMLADARQLPLKDGVVDTVVCDPPYLKGFRKDWEAIISESIRVLKPNGIMIWYSPTIPYNPALRLDKVFIGPNYTQYYYRILTTSIKQPLIKDYLPRKG